MIDLSKKCIAYWKLDDNTSTFTVLDYSKHVNYGESQNRLTVDMHEIAPSGLSGGLRFIPDFNDHIRIPFNDDIAIRENNFSIAAWVKAIDVATNQKILFHGNDGANNVFFHLEVDSDGSAQSLIDSGEGATVGPKSVTKINDNEWHFVVATFTRGGDGQIYIDGYADGPPVDVTAALGDLSQDVFNVDIVLDFYIGARYRDPATNFDQLFQGAIANVQLFNTVLTQDEILFLWNQGRGTENLYTPDDYDGPSLSYPNGGEIFTDNQVTITWTEPVEISLSSNLNWYEIYFTESYNRLKQPEWLQIGMVPVGNNSFVWNISPFAKGDKCRVGIRAVNHRGERSKISISAADFYIQDRRLPKPSVLDPHEGYSYFSYVPIILDPLGVVGQCSERAFYQIYYSSKEQGIDWTLIANNISINTKPIRWDIRDLNSSEDYVLKIELVDDDNISEPVFIENIKINTLNYYLVDTQPPTGTIEVINNLEYIKDRDVIVNTKAYDETSGTESMRIEQFNINAAGNTTDTGPYQKLTDLSTWHIKGDDGVKLIQSRFRDYAGNVVLDNSIEEFFRTYKSLNNIEVTAFLSDIQGTITNLWTAFGGSNPQLYLNTRLVSTVAGEITSMEVFDNILYIGIETDEGKGTLQRYTGGVINTVYEIDTEESVISTMKVFDGKLFLGLRNGRLLSFNGTSVTLQNASNIFDYNIYYLDTDGNVLYIFLDNYKNVFVMRKDTQGQYFFSEIVID